MTHTERRQLQNALALHLSRLADSSAKGGSVSDFIRAGKIMDLPQFHVDALVSAKVLGADRIGYLVTPPAPPEHDHDFRVFLSWTAVTRRLVLECECGARSTKSVAL